MISSKSPNLLWPNLVWWRIIHYKPDCLPKRLVCCLQGQGHSEESCNQNVTSGISSELLILLQLNLVWWHISVSWIVMWKDWITLLWSRSRSQRKFRKPVSVHLDYISSTAELSFTRLGTMMHHHGPECHASRLVCCLQVQGHSEGAYNQIRHYLPYLLNCWSFCNHIYCASS